MATRVFLGLMVLLWLPYGIFCFFQPGFLDGAAGVSIASTTGNIELRAMYGGLQAGIGLLALAGFLRPALARSAVLAMAFLAGGLGVARLLGVGLEGEVSTYTGFALALELTLVGVSVWLLRSPSQAAAT